MSTPRHIVESQQFGLPLLDKLFYTAEHLREQSPQTLLSGRTMASLFYEPSTRTRFSFEAAMYRLGGSVLTTENAQQFSSFAKGESLQDTISVMAGYCDLIVMRHLEIGAAKEAAAFSHVPIINAGDGAGQHPTQALLDWYTLRRRFGRVDGLKIAFVGDLRYGRTVRSLAYLLSKYENMEMYFIAPDVCQLLEDMQRFLQRQKVRWYCSQDLDEILPQVDCVYMTRIQKERFLEIKEFEQAENRYRLSARNLPMMRTDAMVMHPLPRLKEIAAEIDSDPRAYYFEQAQNGLWTRMALILYVLDMLDKLNITDK